jgi:methionyl aminopeptidase
MDDAFEKYCKAGEIAARVREEMKRTIKEDTPIINICEKAEEMIKNMGGKPAFPCNVSINEIAAHYTSPMNDEKRVPKGSLVKVDVGVQIDGYIADTAITVCFDPEYEGMIHAAEQALETAIKIIRPGISTSQLGSEIQRVIEQYGFKPVSNLTGHQIGRYMIHAGKSLPNVSHLTTNRINEGEVYAIEPFVTLKDAAGRVKNSSESYIFRFIKRRPLKSAESLDLLKYIEKNFYTLPFAERWLKEFLYNRQYRCAFSNLLESKCLVAYPVFVEVSQKRVAQAEHTVYVRSDGAVVMT